MWCIGELTGAYVAAMEEVLDLYAEAPDPEQPLVCYDELHYQLIAETRQPLPASPGQAARYDYEYKRNGSCNVLLILDPHGGKRYAEVQAHRGKAEFAAVMKRLVDQYYPQAKRIRVVLDNLNTHTKGALYDTFDAATARRLASKLEFHYTPKHGSWVNRVEVEFSVLVKQSLQRRLGSQSEVAAVVAAYVARRNEERATVGWALTTETARTKLQKHYPTIL